MSGPRPYPGYAALRDEVISLAYDRMRRDPLPTGPDRDEIRKAAKRLKRAQKVEDAAKIARMWAS